uniref:SRCR domain-containing protein n=1 Tax=Neogobius melanostomus TaxID=47308 RepID=A0A8C6TU88_9GOBI
MCVPSDCDLMCVPSDCDLMCVPSDCDLMCVPSDSVRLIGGGACVQDLCRSRTSPWPSPGPGSVRGPWTVAGQRCCAGSWAVGLLSSRGHSLLWGRRSTVRETSLSCNRTRTGPETCPTLNLTCKEPLRLVGGASRCEGTVEAELRGEWRRVTPYDSYWDLEAAAVVCRDLDCGSPVSTEQRDGSDSKVWGVYAACVKKSSVRDCLYNHDSSPSLLHVICSDSVWLVGGRSLCSGSLQIQDQSLAQSWAGVCEGALDRRGAEVLCRELGCGAPLLQGRSLLWGRRSTVRETSLS